MENPIKFTHADAHKFSAFRSLFEVVDVRKDFLAGQEWKTMSVKREIVGGKRVAFPFHVSSHGASIHGWQYIFTRMIVCRRGLASITGDMPTANRFCDEELDHYDKDHDLFHAWMIARREEREILNSCAKPSTTSQRKGGSL